MNTTVLLALLSLLYLAAASYVSIEEMTNYDKIRKGAAALCAPLLQADPADCRQIIGSGSVANENIDPSVVIENVINIFPVLKWDYLRCG